MPIKVTCSNCGGVLHAPDDAGGKRGRCPTCGNILPIPAVGAAPAPAPTPEPPRPAPAKQSFGDLAFGDKVPVGPPRAAEPPARPAPEPRRQSVPLPPPPDDDRPARKPTPTSPFTKPGTVPDATDGTVRAWKKARGGLWWVRSAVWLFLVPIVGLNGLRLYEHFNGPLPFNGVLNMEGVPAANELDLALLGAPVALALVCLVFGRLGFSGVPRRSGARGQALFAALATLVALGGFIALLFPPVSAFASGERFDLTVRGEWQLFMMGDALALIQRFGLTVGIAGLLVAEFWFVGALGRAATALDDRRFGGRVTRFTLLLGFVALFLLGTGTVRPAATEGERARAGAVMRPAPKADNKGGNPEQAPVPRDDQDPKEPPKDPKEKGPKGKGKGKEKGGGGGLPAPPEIAPVGSPAVSAEPYLVPEFDFNASVKRTGEEVQTVVQKEYVSALNQLLPADFAHWPAVRAGAFLLVGLLVGLMYWRMVGAGRRAIRAWLDQHQPT